jgi:hypothetical protein
VTVSTLVDTDSWVSLGGVAVVVPVVVTVAVGATESVRVAVTTLTLQEPLQMLGHSPF